MPTVTSPLLTKSEACKYLRCSPRTLDRRRAAKEIKARKMGGQTFFLQQDLDRLIDAAIERR